MIVDVLMENSALEGFACEHGLSLLIQSGKSRILFDAGQTGLFCENARHMRCDLSRVDLAVLSHGHYDHAGGLLALADELKDVPVWVRPGFDEPHWHGEKYIGIPAELKEQFLWRNASAYQPLLKGITLFSGVPETPGLSFQNQGLTCRKEGKEEADAFGHEQYLVIEEEGKKVLFTGCAHKGLPAILERFVSLWGQAPDVVVGGFHLKKSDGYTSAEEAEVKAFGQKLAAYPCLYLTGHCTGELAFSLLRPVLKERLQALHAGQQIVL